MGYRYFDLLSLFRRCTPDRARAEHLYEAQMQLLEAQRHVEDWQGVATACGLRIRRLQLELQTTVVQPAGANLHVLKGNKNECEEM